MLDSISRTARSLLLLLLIGAGAALVVVWTADGPYYDLDQIEVEVVSDSESPLTVDFRVLDEGPCPGVRVRWQGEQQIVAFLRPGALRADDVVAVPSPWSEGALRVAVPVKPMINGKESVFTLIFEDGSRSETSATFTRPVTSKR